MTPFYISLEQKIWKDKLEFSASVDRCPLLVPCLNYDNNQGEIINTLFVYACANAYAGFMFYLCKPQDNKQNIF